MLHFVATVLFIIFKTLSFPFLIKYKCTWVTHTHTQLVLIVANNGISLRNYALIYSEQGAVAWSQNSQTAKLHSFPVTFFLDLEISLLVHFTIIVQIERLNLHFVVKVTKTNKRTKTRLFLVRKQRTKYQFLRYDQKNVNTRQATPFQPTAYFSVWMAA